MQEIKIIKKPKLWGYELWMHSPLIGSQTSINGVLTKEGPLVKIIKANDKLSVQVHPDDLLAKKLENQTNGKSECWYILESAKDTEFIVGIKTFDNDVIREKISAENLEDLLIKVKPQPYDLINVPAGMVHGIGANSKVLEIQQPSDVTYRFFDYNRMENNMKRELHIEKSLQSIKEKTWEFTPNENGFYEIKDYQFKIYKQPTTVTNKSIIIDLDNEKSFLATSGEKITFNHFAVINY